MFFTPPKIMLYNDGLDNSQTVPLPPVPRAGTTAPGTLRRRSGALYSFAKRWVLPGPVTNSRSFREVRQLFREWGS